MPITAKHKPTKCGLFFALLYREDKEILEEISTIIESEWGKIVAKLSPQYFPMKQYYANEMGTPLGRIYLAVGGKKSRKNLVEAKQWAMKLESKFTQQENRMVNVDPGIICLEQLLLISTKPYSHRIHLEDNLYAELTYRFEQGEYRPLPWTYPDYTESEVIRFFTKTRNILT